MKDIKHKIMIVSGKGGVGKSTVCVDIAKSLIKKGFKVGILDTDLHGPNIPKILDIDQKRAMSDGKNLQLVETDFGLKIMSISFLLEDKDSALIWRGPKKTGIIMQFLSGIKWDSLDYLIIDLPPGTGDEPLSIMQMIPDLDGTIVVTTSSELSISDCKKAINMAKIMNTKILGIVENMSEFICPNCKKEWNIFGDKENIKSLAKKLNLNYLGNISIIPQLQDRKVIDESFFEITNNLLDTIEKISPDIKNYSRDKT